MTDTRTEIPEITVNGRPVPRELLLALLQEHPQGDSDAAVQEIASALVVRELLLEQAEAEGLTEDASTLAEDKVDETIENLLQQKVPGESAAAEDVEAYYRDNEARFVTPPAIEMRHILLACEPDDAAARQQKSLEVQSLIGQLQRGADFGQLAQAHSDCPSKEQGGALGQIAAGQTVPEFEQQVFSLPEGLGEQPIETRFGFHIVNIDQRVEGRPVSFEEASEHIAKFLSDQSRHASIRAYLKELCDAAEIVGIELQLDDEPIAQ